MKKLKLNLDEIKVESFETSDVSFTKGTVNAFADTRECTINGETECFCTATCTNVTVVCGGCRYPTLQADPTCDTSPGCGPSDWTCYGGYTCDVSCMSCPGGQC